MVYSCLICMGSLEGDPNSDSDGRNDGAAASMKVTVTPCGHIFHKSCQISWDKGKKKKTCAYCRKAYPPGSLVRIYPSIDQSLSIEHSEMVVKCRRMEEKLKLAKTVKLNHEKVDKEKQSQILSLQRENMALQQRLREAHMEILRSVPRWAVSVDLHDTKEEVAEEPPPSPSILMRMGTFIGKLRIRGRRSMRVHPQQGNWSEEITGGSSAESCDKERRLRLNERTGRFEDDSDTEGANRIA